MLETRAHLNVVPHAADSAARMDDKTFGELVRDHGPLLRRFVSRLTQGDRHLTEDIVQETLLRLWRRPQTIQTHHTSLRPWLCTVARNLIVDHWRVRQARPMESNDAGLEFITAVRDPIDEAEWARDIAQAMAKLSSDHREVLRLVYYRGLQLKEAANELGLPLGTVKSRTFYALRDLRAALGEMGIEPPRPGTRDFCVS
jgi:RNA polymerase sigma-70 factor (ECF subfamily)